MIYILTLKITLPILVAMYIETVRNRNSPPCILLRESYREHGKVKKRTIANLTHWSKSKLEGLKLLLKGGTVSDGTFQESFEVSQSLSYGHVHAVLRIIEKLEIPDLLTEEPDRDRSLLVAMIASRILFPCSKLATARGLHPETSHCALGLELELDGVSENELYQALRKLLQRQPAIEEALAKRHLSEASLVLYDLSSTYYEGNHCPIAKFGYNRDRKHGKKQINFGVLTNDQGVPIACEVFEGNTSDQATLESQIKKITTRFKLKKVTLVGDRGMLTQARIDEEIRPLEQMSWISALTSDGVRTLVESGTIQPELFDKHQLAEVQSPDFPEERLVVCYNPFLAEERRTRRQELLECTQKALDKIRVSVERTRNPYRGKAKIGRRVQREAGHLKMLKHFELEIQEDKMSFKLKKENVESEARMDGLYVIRAGRISSEEMDANQVVGTYKSLSKVEQTFRTLKLSRLKVRPIFHRLEETVRAHIFLCVLAYYVELEMRRLLAPMLFAEEDAEQAEAQRANPVEPAQPSPVTKEKAITKKDRKGRPIYGFTDLMARLGSITKNLIQPKSKQVAAFFKITKPAPDQKRAFKLLGIGAPG